MSYYKHDGLMLSNGNHKIGNDTMILNMGSALNCPSKSLGFCKLGNKCYALKAEHQYPGTYSYREKQAEYWKKARLYKIIKDFNLIAVEHKRVWSRIKYLRVNESGDFYGQACVDKLSRVAGYLKDHYNITTYTYTAREDLNFKDAHFLVKGSSNNAGNNGKTIARPAANMVTGSQVYYEKGELFEVCPGNCGACYLCKHANQLNVVFPIH